MDKSAIIELAENEVFESDQYDFNPEVRGFRSLFSDEIRSRINDLDTAIALYESLTDEQIERRYSIHYWEVCVIGAYDSFHSDFLDNFHRSIDKRELARREVKNVDLLLNEGKCLILPNNEYLRINEIPSLYEQLVTGKWEDFFNSDELDAYEAAHQEHGQIQQQKIAELHQKHRGEDSWNLAFISWYEQNKNAGPKFDDYFNTNWVLAMQIQALVWYKHFLEKTSETGELYFEDRTEEIKAHNRGKTISMARLRRSNDGYQAITTSFSTFVTKHGRNPQWSELMIYMIENPPTGFLITGKRRGMKVEQLLIEGVDKPIDRAAFKKRYERYFKKMDI